MSSKTGVLAARPAIEKVETGITDDDRKKIAAELSQILTDTYLLVIKTHIYHWNVVGPLFHPIHEMTEEQYTDLFEAADLIAERIRALGFTAPMSNHGILEDGTVKLPAKLASARNMVEDLITDHEKLVRAGRKAADLADDLGDFVTHDLLTRRLTVHEKVIWMLRAMDAD